MLAAVLMLTCAGGFAGEPPSHSEVLDAIALREWPTAAVVGSETTFTATLATFQALLATREASAVQFRITGDVTDRTETDLNVYGFAFPPDRDANVFGAVMGKEGYIIVKNFEPAGLRGGRWYMGDHYFLEKQVGKNGLGINVPIYVFGDAPQALVDLRGRVAALAAQVAALRQEREARTAAVLVTIAPLASEVAAVRNTLDGAVLRAAVARPAVTSRDAVQAVLDRLEREHVAMEQAAPALRARLAAVRTALPPIAQLAVGLLPAPERLQTLSLSVDSGAQILEQRVADDPTSAIAHHRMLLATLPAAVSGTVEDLTRQSTLLAADRVNHPAAWREGPISAAYAQWWDVQLASVANSPTLSDASEEQAVAVLAELDAADHAGVAAGRYLRLVELVEDRLGARVLTTLPANILGSINPWTETRPLGLTQEVRRHHHAIIDRANRAVTGIDLVALAEVLVADRQSHPHQWPDPDRLLAVFALLQGRQFDAYRRRPALVAPFQAVSAAFATAEQDGWSRASTRAFNSAAANLDADSVRTINALVDGAALGPASLPSSPPLWQRVAFAQAVAKGDGSASPIWVGTWQTFATAGLPSAVAAHHRMLLKRIIDSRTIEAVAAMSATLAADQTAAPAMWPDRAALRQLYGRAQVGMLETYIRIHGKELGTALAAYERREVASQQATWQEAARALPHDDAVALAGLLAGTGAVDPPSLAAWCTAWPEANQVPRHLTTSAFWASLAQVPSSPKRTP